MTGLLMLTGVLLDSTVMLPVVPVVTPLSTCGAGTGTGSGTGVAGLGAAGVAATPTPGTAAAAAGATPGVGGDVAMARA